MPSAVSAAAAAAAAKTTTSAIKTTTPVTGAKISSARLKNTTASLPIVYGSIAFYLGKKADELQTHEWTLFLRGPNQHEDHLNGLVISKVVFQLHPSFAQPTRELTEPPYEVTERGWGEFEAQIRIHWKDPTEQTTIVSHTIKLYPQGAPPASAKNDLVQQSTEKPVLAETYDEVVFTEPTKSFFRALTQITAVPQGASALEEDTTSLEPSDANNAGSGNEIATTKGEDKKSRSGNASSNNNNSGAVVVWKNHLTTVYNDQEVFLALVAAQKFLQDELASVKQRFEMVTNEIGSVDQKLLQAQQQKQRDAAAAAVRGGTPSGDRKRIKRSRSAPANKKPRTSGVGSRGGPSTSSGTASGRKSAASSSATASGASRASGGASKTGAKTTSKATTAGSTATKKWSSTSGATSSQALSSAKK